MIQNIALVFRYGDKCIMIMYLWCYRKLTVFLLRVRKFRFFIWHNFLYITEDIQYANRYTLSGGLNTVISWFKLLMIGVRLLNNLFLHSELLFDTEFHVLCTCSSYLCLLSWISELVWHFSMLSSSDFNTESKNSLPSERMLDFLNNFLQG